MPVDLVNSLLISVLSVVTPHGGFEQREHEYSSYLNLKGGGMSIEGSEMSGRRAVLGKKEIFGFSEAVEELEREFYGKQSKI